MKAKPIITLILATVALLVLTGCPTTRTNAIRTDVTYTPNPTQGQPAFTYGSEKDILYKETTTNEEGETVTTEIKVLASAPEYARTERSIVEAQAQVELQKAANANAQIGLQALEIIRNGQRAPVEPDE